jgi:hypothetical protein
MLVDQGLISIRLWTGREVMRGRLEEIFSVRGGGFPEICIRLRVGIAAAATNAAGLIPLLVATIIFPSGSLSRLAWLRLACLASCFVAGFCRKTVTHFSGTCLVSGLPAVTAGQRRRTHRQ